MIDLLRLRQAGFWLAVLVFALAIALLAGLTHAAPARAAPGEWATAGPPERIWVVAVSPVDDRQVLAAGESGVWRTDDGGGTWIKIGSSPVRKVLAIDPRAPATIYSVSTDGRSILKSVDGGATWATAYNGGGSTQIQDVLVDPNSAGTVYAGITAADGLAQVLRSTDAGASWMPILPPAMRGAGGIGQTSVPVVAALPGVPGLLFAGQAFYHSGPLIKSTDGGATWITTYGGTLSPLSPPTALALAGSSESTAAVYAHFSVTGAGSFIRSDDGGDTWVDLSSSLPLPGPTMRGLTNVLVNPAQPEWVYASAEDQPSPAAPRRAGIFASNDRGQTWTELGHLGVRVNGPHGLALAIPSRTLFAATDAGVFQATIAWPVLSRFAEYYDAHDGYRLLGTAISLQIETGGHASQYFEKGRLEDHSGESPDPNWQLMYGLLVDELHGRLASLPVGGDRSSLDYAGLHTLADPAQRVAPPPEYAGRGTMTVDDDGTTFVPFSADLSGAPGHLVRGRFWDYINRPDLFPGGWLHDVGLPITEAVPVQVTKLLPDGPVQRTIVVQAFQRTILTDDPENPPDWQVERANVGTDYRKLFPERVGP